MGTIQHDALIIVYSTEWREEDRGAENTALEFIRGIAAEYVDPIFDGPGIGALLVGPISHTNGYATLFLAPDGSKEGWPTSTAANEMRARIALAAKEHLLYAEVIHVTWGEVQELTASFDVSRHDHEEGTL